MMMTRLVLTLAIYFNKLELFLLFGVVLFDSKEQSELKLVRPSRLFLYCLTRVSIMGRVRESQIDRQRVVRCESI